MSEKISLDSSDPGYQRQSEHQHRCNKRMLANQGRQV